MEGGRDRERERKRERVREAFLFHPQPRLGSGDLAARCF